MQRDAALVLETTEITPGVFVTWYDAPSLAAGATPGQFVMVDPGWETGSFDPLLPRAFSYYRFRRADGVEGERQFALLYAVVGRVTEAMARQQPGDQLWMTGPLGRGFEVNRNARSLLLVGGGVGVAPLVALADQEVERGRSIVLCFGARAAAGVFPAGLLPPQVEYYVSTEDGSLGQKGLVTELFAQHLAWADQSFACGPVPMFRSMGSVVRADGMRRPVQILMETEMACGTGICYGCAVFTRRGVKLCCRDGPRFDLLDIYGRA